MTTLKAPGISATCLHAAGLAVLLLTTLLLLAAPRAGFAQVPLYVSTQTGETSSYSGSYTHTTQDGEWGSIDIHGSGPITWSISPSDFSIGAEETKTWTGQIQADAASAPASRRARRV